MKTTFKTRREALSAGHKVLQQRTFVSGTRGGRIPSSQARLGTVKVIGGYGIIAKRR